MIKVISSDPAYRLANTMPTKVRFSLPTTTSDQIQVLSAEYQSPSCVTSRYYAPPSESEVAGLLASDSLGLLVLVVSEGCLEPFNEGNVLFLGLLGGGSLVDLGLPCVLFGFALLA